MNLNCRERLSFQFLSRFHLVLRAIREEPKNYLERYRPHFIGNFRFLEENEYEIVP